MQKTRRTWTLGFSSALLLLSWVVAERASAQEESPISIELETRAEYNDNLFLAGSGEERDLLFSVFPKFTVDLVTVPVDLQIKYAPQFVLPVNHFDDPQVRRILHFGELTAVSELSSGLQLRLRDLAAAIPVSFGTPDDNSPTLEQSNMLSFEPSQTLEFGGRTDVETTLRANRFDTNVTSGDRTDFGGSVRVVREFHPMVTFGVRGHASRQMFDDSSVTNTLTYGFRGEPTFTFSPRLSVTAGGGVEWLRFDGGISSFDSQYDIRLKYELDEESYAEIKFVQAFLTDSQARPVNVRQLSAKLDRTFSPRTRTGLEVGYGWFDQVAADPLTGVTQQATDTLLTIRPSLWYTLSDDLVLQAAYSLGLNRGENAGNDFSYNQFFVGATYTFWRGG